jgi:hypothetical protein
VRTALLAILLVAACGGGGDDDGVTPPDATVIDGLVPDAIDRCQALCMCTMEFCSDAVEACVTQCQGLDDSVRECRIEHCGYAQTNPTFHCPHALGDESSPGVPAACIQP